MMMSLSYAQNGVHRGHGLDILHEFRRCRCSHIWHRFMDLGQPSRQRGSEARKMRGEIDHDLAQRRGAVDERLTGVSRNDLRPDLYPREE